MADDGAARGDGDDSFGRRLAQLARIDVLLVDDSGLPALDAGRLKRADLLELVDARAGRRATITSQLPVKHGHAWIGEPTIADAMLDRLLANRRADRMKSSTAISVASTETLAPHDEAVRVIPGSHLLRKTATGPTQE